MSREVDADDEIVLTGGVDEEPTLFPSPIDAIDPFIVFANTLHELGQRDPEVAATFRQQLSHEQARLVDSVMANARRRRELAERKQQQQQQQPKQQ